jgi:DHA1 family multidrug resistance protein-like MFS transporter
MAANVISKHLFVLLACLFVVMTGLGITMPVLPFYVERLIWIGIVGYVIAQVLFGLATSLWLLYAAQILGGILSSATLPEGDEQARSGSALTREAGKPER